MKYRPWGPIDWVMSLGSAKAWHFVGAIGTEERCLCCWSHLKALGRLSSEAFAEIHDIPSVIYDDLNKDLLEAHKNKLISQGGDTTCITEMSLMAEVFLIQAFARQSENASSSIVLDISSFPKRFFFLILRILLCSPKVNNLILTYTSAASYADDAPLYEDIEPWRVLPGFDALSTKESPHWVVSVGFLVESLRSHIGDNPSDKMTLLIPFPAPLSVLRRTWDSVANLERGHSDGRFNKFRVETLDLSAAMDRIVSIADGAAKPLAFAPFGPKPTSAAMCLYAIQKGSAVLYPQPKIYHPAYSKGIRHGIPSKAINAYWVKHEGKSLYEI